MTRKNKSFPFLSYCWFRLPRLEHSKLGLFSLWVLLLCCFGSSTVWAAPDLKVKSSRMVADGKQEVQLILSDITKEQGDNLKWNVSSDAISKLTWVKDQLAYAYFRPPLQKGGAGSFKLVGTTQDGVSVSAEFNLAPPLKILTSIPELVLGKQMAMEVGVKVGEDDPYQDFFMKTSLGTLEELGGDRWTLTLPDDLKEPTSFQLSLHNLSRPSMVLASRRMDVKSSVQLQGQMEPGTQLFIVMGKETLGPFDAKAGMPKLEVPAGIKEIIFRAIDPAGNKTEVVKKVNVRPSWEAVLTPETFSLPVGGMSTVISMNGLPESVTIDQIKASAKFGQITALQKNNGGRWTMVYLSPETMASEEKSDLITVDFKQEGKNTHAQLDMEILPGLLDHTESKVLAATRNEDGGLSLSYQLRLMDRDGRALEDLGFSLISALGDIGEITDSGSGNYSFTLTLPAGVEPDKVDLELNLRPEFYDVLSSQIKLWAPPGPQDPKCLVLVTNDEGHPLGNVDMLVSVEGGRKSIIKTNAMGIISVPFPEDGPKLIRMTVEFKGFAQTRRELVAPRPSLLPMWREDMGDEALPPKVATRMTVVVELESFPVALKLPKKDGQVEEIVTQKDPASLALKIQSDRLVADGATKTKGTLTVLNEVGLAIAGHTPELRIVKGDLGTLQANGDGTFDFELTAPLLTASESMALTAELAEFGLKESVKIRYFVADSTEGLVEESITLATPTMTLSATSVIYPDVVTVSIEQKDSDGNAVVDGTVITLAISGEGSLSASSVKTSSGKASLTFTPTNKDGKVTVTAKSEGGTASGTIEVKAIELPAFAKPELSLSATSTTYPKPVTLNMVQNDVNGTAVIDGVAVTIASDGKGTLSASSAKMASGKASVTYTPTNAAGTVTFTVTSEGGSATISLEVSPAALVAPTIASDINEGGIGSVAKLTIRQKDENGNSAPDGTVVKLAGADVGSLSATSVTLSGGEGSATYTFEDVDADVTLSASNDGGEGTVSLKSIALALAVPTLKSDVTEGKLGDTATLTITQKYTNGDAVADGTVVNLSGADVGSLSTTSISLSGGTGTAKYTFADVEKELTLKASNDGGEATVSLTSRETIVLVAPTIKSDISEGKIKSVATLTIQQLTTKGNPSPDGTVVKVSMSGGAGELSGSSVTLSGGSGSLKYTFVDEDATVVIKASHDVGEGSVSLTSKKRVVQAPTLAASPTEITFPETSKVTAKVTYEDGSAVDDGIEVEFTWDGGSNKAKTSGGKAELTFESKDATKTVTVTGTTSGGSGTVDISQKESAKPPESIEFTSSIPKTIRIGETLDFTALAKDKNKDPVKDSLYDLKWTATLGSLSSSSTATSSGTAKNTWNPGTAIGSATIEVTHDSVRVSAKIEILAGKMDRDKSKLTFEPNPVSGDGKSMTKVNLEARDSYNNLIASSEVEFKILTTAAYVGTLSRSKDTTDGSGLADTIYTTGIGTGSVEFSVFETSDSSNDLKATLVQQSAPTTLTFEDKATGGSAPSGSLVSSQTALSLYSISRDDAKNFVDNRAVDWSFAVTSGTIAATDLVASTDGKSATFTPRGAGVGIITIASRTGETSLTSATFTITVTPGAVTDYYLTGTGAGQAGVFQTVNIEAVDAHLNRTTNMSPTTRSLTFSGLSVQGGQSATVRQGTTTSSIGSAMSVAFTAGIAAVEVSPVKVETATLKVSEGTINSSKNLSITVIAGTLASFSLQNVQLTGTSTIHLLATAFDTFGNAIASHDPTQDITFSLSTGTKSGQNITWFDLPTGGSDLRDGSALLSATSFGTFDTQGRIRVGIANTLAETNVFEVKQGSISARSSAFVWSPDGATNLVFGTKPTSGVLQGATWSSFTVQVLDDFGNVLTTDNGRLISLTTISGNGTLTNSTATTTNGVAIFSTVVATSPGVLQFQATATGLRSTVTWETSIFGGSIASIKFTSQPTTATAGTAVSYTVEVLNGGGTRKTDYAGTLNLTSSDGSATLGNLSFSASDLGVKTFDVTYATAGSQTITLTESTTSSITVNSSALTVSAGAATKLGFSSQLTSAVVNKAWNSLVVLIQDAKGNTVNTSTATVTLAKLTGAGTLSGTLTATAVAGVATFNPIQSDTVETITVRASSTGLTSADSSNIVIANAGLYRFAIETPFSSLSPGSPSLVNGVKAVDANGDVVSTYVGTIQFTSTDASATLPANYTFTSADGGITSFTNGVTFLTAGSHTFTVTDASAGVSSTSSTFTVAVGLSKARTKASEGGLVKYWTVSRKTLKPEGNGWQELRIEVFTIDSDRPLISEVSVTSGGRTLWKKMGHALDQPWSWRWQGTDDSGQSLESGRYTLNLVVADDLGRVSQLESELELDGNIDLGHYGP